MTKTYRDVEHAGYFRRPKTHNQRKCLLAAEEEILEELGPNYLGGNFAKINNIPTAYTDLLVVGRYESPSFSEFMENKFKETFDFWVDKDEGYYGFNLKFDSFKNKYKIGRRQWGKGRRYCYNTLVHYIPTCLKIKDKIYHVKIEAHIWK